MSAGRARRRERVDRVEAVNCMMMIVPFFLCKCSDIFEVMRWCYSSAVVM
jgi:hypothetical protein